MLIFWVHILFLVTTRVGLHASELLVTKAAA